MHWTPTAARYLLFIPSTLVAFQKVQPPWRLLQKWGAVEAFGEELSKVGEKVACARDLTIHDKLNLDVILGEKTWLRGSLALSGKCPDFIQCRRCMSCTFALIRTRSHFVRTSFALHSQAWISAVRPMQAQPVLSISF